MNAKIRQATNNGKTYWCADYKIDGQRIRKFFPTEAKAQEHVKTMTKDESKFGQSWIAMDPEDRLGLAQFMAKVKVLGVSLDEILRGYEKSKAAASAAPAPTDLSLQEGITAYCDWLEHRAVRQRYTNNAKYLLNLFARGREKMLVSELTPELFQEWFDARKEHSVATLRGDKTRFTGFCMWAIKKGHMREGTMKCPTPVSPVEIRKGGKGQIRIVTPDEARALLRVTALEAPEALVFLTLAMFCGVRPEEVVRLKFGDLDLKDRHVMLEHGQTKNRWARIAPIPENAIAWLELAQKLGQWGWKERHIPPMSTRQAEIRKEHWIPLLKDGWQQDILRHSTASYRYEQCKNKDIVAKELGNTPLILTDNYLRPVKPEAMQAFYALVPTPELERDALAALEKAKAHFDANQKRNLARARQLASAKKNWLAKQKAEIAA